MLQSSVHFPGEYLFARSVLAKFALEMVMLAVQLR